MKSYIFNKVLLSSGWEENVCIEVDQQGIITSIASNSDGKDAERVSGYAIPGFQNAHSHAFQYAMAGLAERHDPNALNDDFWSWRETMYKIALTMDPKDIEAVAAMLYAEMVRHGYTHVAEFHYLHHQKSGNPYENLAEHGERLIAAAKLAGINITLVPMFYQKGGFGQEPQDHQRRFISRSIDEYWKLLEATKRACQPHAHASYGWGIHSLRAVSPEDVVKSKQEAEPGIPFHIHISEQLKEVNDAREYLKKRPVLWLLDNVEVDENSHLVHATHLDDSEVKGIARSGAHVVLCPSTEGNLGDGIFPLKSYQNQGGKWSIGTDSHIGLNPMEELRILDYGQRLTTHSRSTFVDKDQPDSGHYGFEKSLISGRKAMGNANEEYFAVGQSLDAVVYASDFPLYQTASNKHLLSTIIYSGDVSGIMGTMVAGEWQIKNQWHKNRETIIENFSKTIKKLAIR